MPAHGVVHGLNRGPDHGVTRGSAVLLSIAVTPDVTMIGTTATQQMTATGTYSDTSTADITASVSWGSATGTVATINGSGLATAAGPGTSVITATSGAISGNTTLCVCPRDATSNVFRPVTQLDWDAVFRRATKLVGYTIASKTPTHTWGFQDTADPVTATIGTNLTSYGSPTFNQTVTGQAAKGVLVDNGSAEGMGLAAGAAPNPSSTSALWLCYADIGTNTSANHTFLAASAAANALRLMILITTQQLRLVVNGVNFDGSLDHQTGNTRPYVLAYDRTNSLANAFSDREQIVGTYAAQTDSSKGFPNTGSTVSAQVWYSLGAAFAGANAEWTDGSGGTAASRSAANIKAVLSALGWTISY